MKKLLTLLLALVSLGAQAAANDLTLQQRNSTDTAFITRFLAQTAPADSILYFNGTTVLPGLLTLGSGMSITAGSLTCTATGAQADWTAVSGPSAILNKPSLAAVATSGAYSDLTGAPSLAAVATSGAYADLSGKPTIPAAQVNSDWTAVSGVAQVLNKPTLATVATSGSYTDLGNKPTIPAAQVNSDWNASSGLAQILNKPTIPATPSQSSASRSLNTAFQVSTTRAALVFYSVQITVTASIAGGQNGDVVLEVASDSGFTTNVQTLSISGVGQTYTLAIALQGVQPQTSPVSGFVPAGYYARLRTVNNTGTPAFSYRAGQEVLL